MKLFCMMGIILLYSFSSYSSADAGWIENGMPLTPLRTSIGEQQVIADGFSGQIVAYEACHDGVTHIFVQHINASGSPIWMAGGVRIGAGNTPALVSDGAGGAIITWQDDRTGLGSDIYVQRVNAAGELMWTDGGVVVFNLWGEQQLPQIVSDDAGGAIITWQDNRTGDGYDIYAQRVDASGTLQWYTYGLELCTATEDQKYPQIASDGASGAIVTWEDKRDLTKSRIFTQRVNAAGIVQWQSDGIVCCADILYIGTSYPRIIPDGSGGVIIIWRQSISSSPDGVYAQRVSGAGILQWAENGVLLGTASWNGYDPCYHSISSDGAGGALVAWSTSNIYAQRVNGNGVIQWNANGVIVCSAANDQESPEIVNDGSGGAIIVWEDQRRGVGILEIYAQRVSATGSNEWSSNGIEIGVTDYPERGKYPKIVSDNSGGAIINWTETVQVDDPHIIYSQRVNADGVAQWGSEGLPICPVNGIQYGHQMVSDGAGGAIVAWVDTRNRECNIYAQHVGPLGRPEWDANAVLICTIEQDNAVLKITSDGEGGAIVTWVGYGLILGGDAYAQRVNASGIVQWGQGGIKLFTASGLSSYICSDGVGGAIIAQPPFYEDEIYVQRVNTDGVLLWGSGGVIIPSVTISGKMEILSDQAGGAILVWYSDSGMCPKVS